jgi:hypothetical protein
MADISSGSMRVPHSVINPRKMTPITCILVMMLIWAGLFAVAPIKMYASAQLYPYLILGLSFGGLLLGLSVFEMRSIPKISVDPAEQQRLLRILYKLTFSLGLCGIVFRIIDWVVYRGFAIGLDFAENMQKASEGGGNAFSSMAVFLVPFTVAPYMFYAVARRNGWRVGRTWTAAGLAILWPILTLMLGSRSSMFMQVGMLVIARVLIFPRFPKIAFWTVLVVFLTLVYAAGFLFIERVTQFGLNIDKVARLSVFTNLVPATGEYYHLSATLSESLKNILFINTTMMQYYLHGVPEFVYLVEHYGHGEAWGGFTFTSVTRILAALAGRDYDAETIINLSPRLGVYTTFFGPLFIDFGPLTPVVAVLLGAFVSWVRRQVLLGNVVALPLYTALLMQMLAAVVVCAVNAAYGVFYDLAFAGLWIGCALSYRRSLRIPHLLRSAA